MSLAGFFDSLFISQLLAKGEQGETAYYPHGRRAQGYLVPPEREAGVRSRLRWLVIVSQIGTLALVVVLPRLVESWLGYEIPLPWFIGGAVVAVVVIVAAIIGALSRIAVGLTPVQK
jgi:hypothetical protein